MRISPAQRRSYAAMKATRRRRWFAYKTNQREHKQRTEATRRVRSQHVCNYAQLSGTVDARRYRCTKPVGLWKHSNNGNADDDDDNDNTNRTRLMFRADARALVSTEFVCLCVTQMPELFTRTSRALLQNTLMDTKHARVCVSLRFRHV